MNKLSRLSITEGLKALKTIDISVSESLENLDGLHGCNSLEEIKISGGDWDGNSNKQSIKNVDGLIGLKKLRYV